MAAALYRRTSSSANYCFHFQIIWVYLTLKALACFHITHSLCIDANSTLNFEGTVHINHGSTHSHLIIVINLQFFSFSSFRHCLQGWAQDSEWITADFFCSFFFCEYNLDY
mmetsp:Transcript_30597/g.50685  ORF Transcript_30597/g.50685 Transcript_30597/m.50685 type:complete len:111 (+) Transcript_30597:1117-1449(+)